jgi:hypothetical protein
MDDAALIRLAGQELTALTDGVATRALAMVAERPAGPNMLKAVLAHQLVAGHALMMRLAAKTELFFGLIAADRTPDEQDRGCRQAVRLSGAAARLTERYRQGLVSLARLQGWAAEAAATRSPAADPLAALAHADPGRDDDPDDLDADDSDPDKPDGGGPRGGRRSPARLLAELAAFDKAARAALNGGKPNGAGNGTHLQASPAQRDLPAEASAKAGRLRNGNPSGDLAKAPRCGARTRAGHPCGQPAMPNGRCRLHGGMSTGARTATGRARCRTAGHVHGERSAEIIDLKRAAARHGRRLQALAAEADRLANAESKKERATPCQARIPAGRTATGGATLPATRDRLLGSTTLSRDALRAPDGERDRRATGGDATTGRARAAHPYSPPRLRASA